GRVREHEVEGVALREGRHVSRLEAQAASGVWRTALEHCRRAVQADGLARGELLMQLPGQLARPAPEVDDAHVRPGPHEAEEVTERLLALGTKALVLLRIPGVGRHAGRLGAVVLRRHARQQALRVAWAGRSRYSGAAWGTVPKGSRGPSCSGRPAGRTSSRSRTSAG